MPPQSSDIHNLMKWLGIFTLDLTSVGWPFITIQSSLAPEIVKVLSQSFNDHSVEFLRPFTSEYIAASSRPHLTKFRCCNV